MDQQSHNKDGSALRAAAVAVAPDSLTRDQQVPGESRTQQSFSVNNKSPQQQVQTQVLHQNQRGTLTWTTHDESARVDTANVVSLAGHEGSVIVLGKMPDGQLHSNRDDCQDILLMVELKYKDVLLQELQAQAQAQGQLQHDSVHVKPHAISYAAPKTRILNYVTDPQQPAIIKGHPHVAYSPEAQAIASSTHSGAYSNDHAPISIGKTHFLAYDTQGNAQTFAYPTNMQPFTLAKAPNTGGPNTHVISLVPDSSTLGHLEYAATHGVGEQAKAAYGNACPDGKIEAIVFGGDLSSHHGTLKEALTGEIINDGGILKLSSNDSMKPFPCPTCNKRFMRRTNLRAHMAQHSSERPYSCDTCGKRFAMRWDLTLHARLHTGIYQCDICSKAFSVKGKLERHRRVHSGERPFACPQCGKAFSDKHNLDAHIRTHSDQRPYACLTCGRSFRSRSHLRAHRRVHTPDTPFSCSLCGKSFKWKANLNLHIKVHTGERVKCERCGREFTRRGDLVRHRRSHEGLRPFSCGLCPRSYADRAALNKHMKSHQEHRPFTCDICNKSFHFMWYLNSHKKMHTDERKLKCPICNKEFSKRGNLTTHLRLHDLMDVKPDGIVSTVSSNSLETEDTIHSSSLEPPMKVEVSMSDLKVDIRDLKVNVSGLPTNPPNSIGVLSSYEAVNVGSNPVMNNASI